MSDYRRDPRYGDDNEALALPERGTRLVELVGGPMDGQWMTIKTWQDAVMVPVLVGTPPPAYREMRYLPDAPGSQRFVWEGGE